MTTPTHRRSGTSRGSARGRRPARPRLPARALAGLEGRLGHRFADRKLLSAALTHASLGPRNNERLEFLGDRVLGLMAADALCVRFPDAPEGALAQRLNALVRKETCAEIARALDLGPCLLMAEGEAAAGGREKETILADACEALIGALYLDGGLEAAQRTFLTYWADRLDEVADAPRDAKTLLQEWSHAENHGTPDYRLVSRSGPDHAPSFRIEVTVTGAGSAEGEGDTKRGAEQAAAEALLVRHGVRPA